MAGRLSTRSTSQPASRLWRIDANSAKPGRGSPIADIPAAATEIRRSRGQRRGTRRAWRFKRSTRDVDLHLMDLDARLVNDTIESQPFSNSTRIEGSARFSPDGSRIAFASFRSGAQEIWVAGRDGSGLRQVTTLGASGVLVGGWSPDGSQIAFEAAIDGNTDVYVVGSRWRAPASADRRTLHRRSSVVVGGRTVDLFRVDARRSDCGHLAGLCRRRPSHPTDTQRRLRAAGISGRPVSVLSRPSSGGLAIGEYCQADAPPSRWRTGGTGARARSAVSVVGHGHRDRVRHPRAGLRCDRSCTGSAIGRLPAWAGWDFGYRGSTRT